ACPKRCSGRSSTSPHRPDRYARQSPKARIRGRCSGSKARARRAATRVMATNTSLSRLCCRSSSIRRSRNSRGAGKRGKAKIPASIWRFEMISVQEFLIRAHLEHRSLEAWIAAGWLIPPQTEPELMFSDIDLARAQLIGDLREASGVNDEGILATWILVDQLHGLRGRMEGLLDEMGQGESPAAKGGRFSAPARRMSAASRRR